MLSLGISDQTRRDPRRPRRWMGLRPDDGALLAIWVDSLGASLQELHTHVPVASDDVDVVDVADPRMRRLAEQLYPRRVDAVLLIKDEWWLVECKPSADHMALGQVLCYAFWWEGLPAGPDLQHVAVLTDQADEMCRRAYFAHGVELIELGPVLGRSPSARRLVIYQDLTS